jgi:NOL1/NOP2/sun family putative RNA methylase
VSNLPAEFVKRYQSLLSPGSSEFLASFSEPPLVGLRVNTLKITVHEFLKISPFPLKPIPWSPSGFIVPHTYQPGKHPYHAAGLYYLQEPSAMAVSELLAPQSGDRVLDLAAAPGGKATHLAALMKNEGILVANDIHSRRVWDLAENLERCGVRNTCLLNESPENFIPVFENYFDRVLLDAPCSGEGMFRRSKHAISDWSQELVLSSSHRQSKIMHTAARLLRPGGTLVYSTCTFSPEENEHVIDRFMTSHPEFELIALPYLPGFSNGHPGWVDGFSKHPLQNTIRIWPHQAQSEGHFIAALRKSGTPQNMKKNSAYHSNLPDEIYALFQDFCQQNLRIQFEQGSITCIGSYLYQISTDLPHLSDLKVIHPGWWLGIIKKKRFEPAHALALGLSSQDVLHNVHLETSHSTKEPPSQVYLYLRGEQLALHQVINKNTNFMPFPERKSWGLFCLDNYPVGWVKFVGDLMKNYYPRGLRWL